MASPITVSVNFIDLTGNAISGYIEAALVSPCGTSDFYVTSTGIIAPKTITSGVGTSVSVQVWGNDIIIDTLTGEEDTYYTVNLFDSNNNLIWSAAYLFTGSSPVNLVGYPTQSSLPPCNPTGPPTGSTPGGSNTDVQYNNGGVFGGDASFTFNNSTLVVTGDTFNATTGFTVSGAATAGYYLRGNGTDFVSSAIQAGDLPSGFLDWNNIANASGNLTLANAGYSTTFNQTSAVTWEWANTTAATSIANQNSPALVLAGTGWNGSASIVDSWTIQDVITGVNSELTFSHTGLGSSGISLPVSVSVGALTASEILSSGNISTFNGSGYLAPSPAATNTNNYDSGFITFQASWWNGSAAVTDATTIEEVVGSGETPTSVLKISNSGAYSWGGLSVVGSVNSTGLQINSAAPEGSVLQGNGTNYVACSTPMFLAGVMLPNPKLINTQSVALPSTGTPTTAIYTVPTGRRAYFNGYGFGFITNNVHIYPGLEISSVNYALSSGTAIGVATYSFSKLCSPVLIEAGQSLTITPSGAVGAGGFFSAEIIEFDNTAPLQQVFLTTIGNASPTTFYAPSGQGAQIMDLTFQGIGSTTATVTGGIQFYNFTGTNATIDIYYTPNGGSQLTIDALSVATTTVDTGSTPTAFGIPVPLANGDLLTFQSNQTSGSATQYAWGNILIL